MSTPNRQVDAAAAATPRTYWPVPVLRALPALAVGLAVTFFQDHSPVVGFGALAVLGIGTGAVIAITSGRIAESSTRHLHLALGILAVVLGLGGVIAAIADAGFATLLLLATVYLLLTGALELFAGIRSRKTPVGRDWRTVGIGTVVLAIVLLVFPGDSIFVVGLIGAYAAVLGVYLVIAGLSLKWAAAPPPTGATVAPNTGARR